MDVEPAVLAEADTDAADSLISTNDPDDMANEQTWPTEDEMQNGEDHQNGDSIPDANKGTTPKQVRKVPKGTSAYQATWIVDDDSEAEDGASEEEAEVAEPVEEEEMVDLPEVDMDAAETETDRRTVQFQDLEEDEEQEQ
jgi:pre-rRNA-processing protein TSR1